MPRPKRHVNGLEPLKIGEPLWLKLQADPNNFVCRCGRILPRTPELETRGYCYDKTKLGHGSHATGNSDGNITGSETDHGNFSSDLPSGTVDLLHLDTDAEDTRNETRQSDVSAADRPPEAGEAPGGETNPGS